MAFEHGCYSGASIRCPRHVAGRPRGKKCPVCGTPWTVVQGRYALLEWREDGRYSADQALLIRSTQTMAERGITDPNRQMVRFLAGA